MVQHPIAVKEVLLLSPSTMSHSALPSLHPSWGLLAHAGPEICKARTVKQETIMHLEAFSTYVRDFLNILI